MNKMTNSRDEFDRQFQFRDGDMFYLKISKNFIPSLICNIL